jgi:YD repeat-containing protein
MRATLSRVWQSLPPHARKVTLTLVLALASILPSPAAADISYVYDNAGRLRAVIDPASNTAIYAYL